MSKFLKLAGGKFQTDGTMKLKNIPRKITGFALGFLVAFNLKIGESEVVGKCSKKD